MSNVNLSAVQKKFYNRITTRNRVHKASRAVISWVDEKKGDESLDISEGPEGSKKAAGKYSSLRQAISRGLDLIVEIKLVSESGGILEYFETGQSNVNPNEIIGVDSFRTVGSEYVTDMIIIQEQGNRNSTVALNAMTRSLDSMSRSNMIAHERNMSLEREIQRLRSEKVELILSQGEQSSNNIANSALTAFTTAMSQNPSTPASPVVVPQHAPRMVGRQRVSGNAPLRVPPVNQESSSGMGLSDIIELLPKFGLQLDDIPAEKIKDLAIMAQRPNVSAKDFMEEFLREDELPELPDLDNPVDE